MALDEEHNGATLSDALHHLKLDNEARKLLGGSVVVTRDGRFVFIYAWHEESAQQAEHVVKNLMQDENLAGEVRLMRWHPVAEEWKDASEPLPDDEAARAEEMHEAEHEGSEEAHRYGEYPWEVVIDLPHVRDGQRSRRRSCAARGCRSSATSATCWSAPRRRTRRSRSASGSRARPRRAPASASVATQTTCRYPPSST